MQGDAQDFNSAMGFRFGNGVQWTGKIWTNSKTAVVGFLGVTNLGLSDSRAGASIQYQRIHRLLDLDNVYLFYGGGLIGEIGDQEGLGIGPSGGIQFNLWKKLNLELDIFPAYYLSEELDVVINYGISFRYISRG